MKHLKLSTSSAEAIELEKRYGAFNYKPLPVVLAKGQGAVVWDVEGKQYLDFLSAYSSGNQGHCHPKIIGALVEQASRLTLTSRAFHHDSLGKFEEKITTLLGYERMLPGNGGVEAWEASIKLARKWGYQKKKIPQDQAKVIVCQNNFHGRTLGAVSASTSASAKAEYGPYLPGFIVIPFNDLKALEKALEDPNVVGFNLEPIQGEAGVLVPDEGYLSSAYRLCKNKQVLFIADEIQTGLCRTGKWMACDYEHVKPDILTLGKALSGGVTPVSAILSSSEIMLCIKPGEHGSTYAGNPLACQVAMAALEVLVEEKLDQRAFKMGEIFRKEMRAISSPLIKEVRGKGLLNAIEIAETPKKVSADDVSHALMKKGVLAKPTRETTIRFAPALVITEEQMKEACASIRDVLTELS